MLVHVYDYVYLCVCAGRRMFTYAACICMCVYARHEEEKGVEGLATCAAGGLAVFSLPWEPVLVCKRVNLFAALLALEFRV